MSGIGACTIEGCEVDRTRKEEVYTAGRDSASIYTILLLY